MLTIEKAVEVFKDYLSEDTRYEIVITSHGYTVLEWDSTAKARIAAQRQAFSGFCRLNWLAPNTEIF